MRKFKTLAVAFLLSLCLWATPISAAYGAQPDDPSEKTIVVTVEDENGNPIPHFPIAPNLIDPGRDAEKWMPVDYRREIMLLDETDENGQYTFRTKYGRDYWVYIKDGLFPVLVSKFAMQEYTVEYAPPDFSMTFNVTDSLGNPMDDVYVHVIPHKLMFKGMRDSRSKGIAEGYVSQQGQFVWENAVSGAHFLQVGNADYSLQLPFVVGPNTQDLSLDVQVEEVKKLYPTARRTLAFRSAENEPLKNKRVYQAAVSYPGGEIVPFREQKTNEKGEMTDVFHSTDVLFLADGIPVSVAIPRGKNYIKAYLPRE